jgi:hypothetical protein
MRLPGRHLHRALTQGFEKSWYPGSTNGTAKEKPMTTAIELHSELYPGRVALVDDDDYPALSGYTWCINRGGYAVARIGGKHVYMHRLIMPGVLQLDHANGHKLDNRRSNLREATASQNLANTAKRPGTSSKFKGVTLYRATGKWMAQIQVEGVKRHLGYFTDETDAAAAYDQAAVEAFGEFARLNFS